MDYESIGRTISRKKSDKKQKINIKMSQAKQKTTTKKCKFDSNKKTRHRMNCDWIGKNHLEKNPIPKNG